MNGIVARHGVFRDKHPQSALQAFDGSRPHAGMQVESGDERDTQIDNVIPEILRSGRPT